MKKITILYIEFLEDTAANHLLMIIKGLRKYKKYTIMCLCQKNSYLSKELRKENFKYIYEFDYHNHTSTNKLNKFYRNIHYFLLLVFITVKHNITIIHAHRVRWAYIATIVAGILRKPIFIQIIVIENTKNIFKNFFIKLMTNVTYIAVSHSARKQFLNMHRINPERVLYHYGGLYFPDIVKNYDIQIPTLEKSPKNRKKFIGMISRMDPLKGIDVFIESAALLSKKFPNLYFVHIGRQVSKRDSYNYFNFCKKRVDNLQLSDRFTFIDYKDNILPYFKYFYITVLPTYKDTLAYVNIESNAYGVPSISTAVDGVTETAVSKKYSLIPFPPSPIILAEKMEQLLNNKTLYTRLSDQVKKNVIENFDAEKNAAGLLQIYLNRLSNFF